jgi:hypothetical protein
VKGWSANIEAANRRLKDNLSVEFEKLDIEYESRCLTGK